MSAQIIKKFIKTIYLVGNHSVDERTYENISEKPLDEVISEMKEAFKENKMFELLEFFSYNIIFMEMNGVKFSSEPVDVVHEVLMSREEVEKRMFEAEKKFVDKVLTSLETLSESEEEIDSEGEENSEDLSEILKQSTKRVLH